MQPPSADTAVQLVVAQSAPSIVTHLERLLTVQEVMKLTTLSRDKIYRLMRLKRFPRPLALSDQRVAWRASAIAEWMSNLPEGGFARKKG